jgi:acyl-CoA thioesterase-1
LFTLIAVTLCTADGAPQGKLPRVLIIGDSISMGYTQPVRQNLAGKAEVFRPPVNCQHTAYGLSQIKKWLGKEKWDVIHFNWGIWDTHMLDANGQLIRDEANAVGPMHLRHTPEQYRENLEQLVKTLEATGAKLIWANTTPVMSRTGKRFEDVSNLNRVAAEVMQKHKIPVNDLYSAVLPNAAKWQTADKVHFNDKGNAELAELVSGAIRKSLGNDEKTVPATSQRPLEPAKKK